jgi:polysaccharide pyruvyl transferase WcaK-like protein
MSIGALDNHHRSTGATLEGETRGGALPKIIFVGCYTIRSAGDDAPLAFLTSALRERLGPCDFLVLARHPDEAFDRCYGVRTIRGFEYETKAASMGRWMRGLNYDDERGPLRAIADEFASADLIVLGAGNFFIEVSFDIFRGNFSMLLIAAAIAELAEKPYLLYGLSANHLRQPWAVRAARWLLRRAASITFRDSQAVSNLQACGVHLPPHEVLPDPALGAPSCDPNRADEILAEESIHLEGKQVLAIALRNLAYMNGQDVYEPMLANVIDRWNRKGPEHAVLFIPQCSYNVVDPSTDDRVIARQLSKYLETAAQCHFIEGNYQSAEIECLYRKAHITLGTRLHGCLFSAKMGTPVVGLSYEDKVKGFFLQLGQPDWCLPWDAEAEMVFERINTIYSARADHAVWLRARIPQLQSDLSRYVDKAVEIIHGERSSRV